MFKRRVNKTFYFIFSILLISNALLTTSTFASGYSELPGYATEEIPVNKSIEHAKYIKILCSDKNGIYVYAFDSYGDYMRNIFIDYAGNVYDNLELFGIESVTDPDSVSEYVEVFNDGVARVKWGDYYGYIDENYNWIIPPVYSTASDFDNGYCVVQYGQDAEYLMNKDGEILVEADYFIHNSSESAAFEYGYSSVFSNGYAAYVKNNEVYYLDKDLNSIKAEISRPYERFGKTEMFFDGGTLVEWRYTTNAESYNYYYNIIGHDGKVKYTYEMTVPGTVALGEHFVNVLSDGNVLFASPNFNSGEPNVGNLSSKFILVSSDGQVIFKTKELEYFGYYGNFYNFQSIDNYIVRNCFVSGIQYYDFNFEQVCDIKRSKEDYVVIGNNEVIYNDSIVAELDGALEEDSDIIEIEKIILTYPEDSQIKRGVKTVDRSRIPNNYKEVVLVYIDNDRLTFDKQPILENDRTLVPMRAIFEALEAEVTWDNDTNTATAVKDGTTISITIDSDVMYKNGEAIQLDAPARLIDDGYTFVPLRAVSEALDCDVQWNEEQQRIDILSD